MAKPMAGTILPDIGHHRHREQRQPVTGFVFIQSTENIQRTAHPWCALSIRIYSTFRHFSLLIGYNLCKYRSDVATISQHIDPIAIPKPDMSIQHQSIHRGVQQDPLIINCAFLYRFVYVYHNTFSHYRIFFDNIRIADNHFVPDNPEEAA